MAKNSASVIGSKFQGMREFVKNVQRMGATHSTWTVFEDFLAMSSISISNAVCPNQEREQRYLDIVKQYSKDELDMFAQMLADLVNTLENEVQNGHLSDVLGAVFHELELHNKYHGQFFTPQHMCDFMAKIVMVPTDKERIKAAIDKNGFFEVGEPACGSGAMVIAMANAMIDDKLNYCSQMVATCTDIDLKCVHMAYLQLALYGIPAVIIHGNSLTLEEWSRWYTPVYVLNGFGWRRGARAERDNISTKDQASPEPQRQGKPPTTNDPPPVNCTYEQLSLF